MFNHAPTIVVRSCLVCGSSFTGYRNRLYCGEDCINRAAKERDYWPKIAKTLEHLGWLVRVIPKNGELMVDTPPINGATRRSMWLSAHAPVSDLERMCKAGGLEFPLTGWANFQPGETPVSMELVERALRKYALCDFCGEIVLREDFVPSLGSCAKCLEKHDDHYGSHIWQDMREELGKAKTLRQRLEVTANKLKEAAAIDSFSSPDKFPF